MERNLEIIEKYNFKTFVSIRNLLDVMVSRYLHLSNDDTQPQYRIYSKYNLRWFQNFFNKNHRENQIQLIILRIGLKIGKKFS